MSDPSVKSAADTGDDKPSDAADTTSWSRHAKLLAYGVASGVLFAVGLILTESVGEVAVDVDFKPFVIPYVLIAINRFGLPTMSVGLGAALGEGVLDVFEGYEIDDPIGFLGYFIGFTVFGWYLHKVADDPTQLRSLTVAATLGAFVQACFEASAFLVFESTAGPLAAIIGTLGNTATHGILLGALPLVVMVRAFPALATRIPPAET